MEKDSSLQEMEKRLYTRGDLPKPPTPTPPPPPLPPPPKEPRPPILSAHAERRIVRILIVVIGLGVVFGAIVFWQGFFGFSNNRVQVEIVGPEKIVSGEKATWQVKIINKNRTDLVNGEIVVHFPKNSKNTETLEADRERRLSFDRISSASEFSQEFSAIVIGGDNFERVLDATIRFRPDESSLLFERRASHTLLIDEFPVSVSLDGPAETLSGETVPLKVGVLNSSSLALGEMRVRFEYPSGFDFSTSQSPLEDSDTIWPIGILDPQQEKLQELFGSVSGGAGEGKVFRAFIEYREDNSWVVYKEIAHRFSLAVLPLTLDINLDGANEQGALSAGDNVRYTMNWRNDFDVPLANVVLTASLDGTMFNLATLNTSGNVLNRAGGGNDIRWTEAQIPAFRALAPGDSGSISFSVDILENFPRSLVNPTVVVSARIESGTKPPGLTVEAVRTNKRIETKLNSNVALSSTLLHNDTVFENSGPNPPRVGDTTTYTVHWALTGGVNALRNVVVSSSLPSGVEWADSFRVPSGLGAISYDSFRREITWSVPSLPAQTGIVAPAPEAVFQLKVSPTPSHVGQRMNIMSSSRVQAEDEFTTSPLSAGADQLFTQGEVIP